MRAAGPASGAGPGLRGSCAETYPGPDGDVEYVEAPGSEGCFGVLAHHAAMVTTLASGTMKVRHAGGKEERW